MPWNSRNLTTRTNQCQLFVPQSWALLGELRPCPSPPPRAFSFWRGWEEGRGPALCVVRGGLGVVEEFQAPFGFWPWESGLVGLQHTDYLSDKRRIRTMF